MREGIDIEQLCDISISADGFSAGHNQTEERPFGDGDTSMLHSWMLDTPQENQAEIEAITKPQGVHNGPQHVRADPRRGADDRVAATAQWFTVRVVRCRARRRPSATPARAGGSCAAGAG